jgi:HSP20 family protein
MAIKDLVPTFGKKRDAITHRRAGDAPFRQFQDEMNRLFDDFFAGHDLPLWPGRGGDDSLSAFTPRVNISETEREVKVSAELPGMDEKDVTVELDDNMINIRGEKREEKEEKDGDWTRREQVYGSFHRMIPLPASVDGQNAKAKFRKGVLTVTAPKREPDKSNRKRVAIECE